MKKCIICGTQGGPDDKVCPNCGNALIDIDQMEKEPLLKEEDLADLAKETAAPAPAASAEAQTPAGGAQQTAQAGSKNPAQQAAPAGGQNPAQQAAPAGGQNAAQQRPAGGQNAAQQAAAGGQAARPRQARRPAPQEARPEGTMVQHRQGTPRRVPVSPQVRQGNMAAALKRESRGLIRSPLFILMTLFGIVYMVGSFLNIFMTSRDYTDSLAVMNNFNVPQEWMGYLNEGAELLDSLGKGAKAFEVVGLIPNLLLVLAAVILVITASKKKPDMSGAGFALVKISLIIKMIVCFALLIVLLVGMVAMTVSAWVSGTTTNLVITVIFLVLTIVVCMMVIMFFFCHLHSRKVVRRNALLGEDYGDVSRYAAVMTILIALPLIVSVLSAVVNNELYHLIAKAAQIGWLLFLGIWMLVYRNHFEEDDDDEE